MTIPNCISEKKKHLILEETRFYAYRELVGTVSNQLVNYWRVSGKVAFQKIHGRYYYLARDMGPLLRGIGVEVTFV